MRALLVVMALSSSQSAWACGVFDEPLDDTCVRASKAAWGIALGGALLTNVAYTGKIAQNDIYGELPSKNDAIGELVSVTLAGIVGVATIGMTVVPVHNDDVADRGFAVGMLAAGAVDTAWSLLMVIHSIRTLRRPPPIDFSSRAAIRF